MKNNNSKNLTEKYPIEFDIYNEFVEFITTAFRRLFKDDL